MVTKELIAYIRQNLSFGKTREEIANNLLTQGWLPTDISEAFDTLSGINPIVKKSMSNLKIFFAAFVLLVAAGAVWWWKNSENPEQVLETQSIEPVAVQTETQQSQVVEPESASGTEATLNTMVDPKKLIASPGKTYITSLIVDIDKAPDNTAEIAVVSTGTKPEFNFYQVWKYASGEKSDPKSWKMVASDGTGVTEPSKIERLSTGQIVFMSKSISPLVSWFNWTLIDSKFKIFTGTEINDPKLNTFLEGITEINFTYIGVQNDEIIQSVRFEKNGAIGTATIHYAYRNGAVVVTKIDQ